MAEITGGWVRYGAEAAEALRVRISEAKGAEPLATVTVVVPSNQVGVSIRRQLASGALGSVGGVGIGLIGVDFLTPYRLAELLGASALAAEGRRPVSTPVVSAAIRHVLRADPGVFAPVVEHPATEAALVSSYRELRDLSEAALRSLAARSDRAREVVRVCRGAHERLGVDEAALHRIEAGLRHVRRQPTGVLVPLDERDEPVRAGGHRARCGRLAHRFLRAPAVGGHREDGRHCERREDSAEHQFILRTTSMPPSRTVDELGPTVGTTISRRRTPLPRPK